MARRSVTPSPVEPAPAQWRPLVTCGGCSGELVRGFGLCNECEFLFERAHAEHTAYIAAATDCENHGKPELSARFRAMADERYRTAERLGQAYRGIDD